MVQQMVAMTTREKRLPFTQQVLSARHHPTLSGNLYSHPMRFRLPFPFFRRKDWSKLKEVTLLADFRVSTGKTAKEKSRINL